MSQPAVMQRQKKVESVIALPSRKFFSNPESFSVKTSKKNLTFGTVFEKSRRLLENLEVFRKVAGKFTKIVETSKKYGKIVDSLDEFYTVWKISRQSGRFPDSLENFRTV